MSKELSSKYNAVEVEKKWYPIWESEGYFKPASDTSKDTYTIVIPPPNVTGILHMGHALNNAIQDILIRWNRMKGKDTLWVPGVDHAGIATQNVVEKKLAKEKITRQDLGREKFLEKVWEWKEDHGNTITNQLRRLGASCDWSREAFTMSDSLSKAVRETFVSLYEKGLIYQGHYIINWCPRCQTALSDEEAEHRDVTGGFYHIKYPVVGAGDAMEKQGEDHIVVATTRPETMLGDTAVAIHPDDERYKHLHGKKLLLPLMNREIPIITDEYVDREFGTGMVKVTPAHDPNDFEMGKRHDLEVINVMHPDGHINENGGVYNGQERFVARKKVIEDLESQGYFVKKEKHKHAVGHCYRCHTVVEPYLSKQWFVKMKPMAEKALEAHKQGKTTFYPDRWTKVYTNWLEGIRDWCISRQIWWGHQIPVWYCRCGEVIVSREDPTHCPKCQSDQLERDPDVLDTWFSSWLWPFSTLGWPEKTEDLKHFYPTNDLVTASEIIFFWVARMIMAGLEFIGEVPFNRIYIHGTVRAEGGLKMSKSLGNSIDPLEIIDEMGADALRFSMIMLSAQDVYISRQKFEVGRNFTNKLWNASRFVMMNLAGAEGKLSSSMKDVEIQRLSLPSKWILSKLERVSKEVDRYFSQFALAQGVSELYHFVWNDYCDWYIELSKSLLENGSEEEKFETRQVLFFVLEKILRLLHPVAPFITEEIWHNLKEISSDGESWKPTVMQTLWPTEENYQHEDLESEKAVEWLQKAVSGIRDLRARVNLAPSQTVLAKIVAQSENVQVVFKKYEAAMKKLGKLESVEIVASFETNKSYIGNAFAEFDTYIYIEGLVDPEKERERMAKKIAETEKWVGSLKKKLDNKNFVANAPADVVESEREKLADAEKILKSHQEHLALFT